jgi:hypothetical protein
LGKTIYTDIEIRGRVYPDTRTAAMALGVQPETVRFAIKAGRLHRCGTGASHPEPLPVRICGLDFAHARDAARHFGVGVSAVYAALAAGDPDRIGRPPRYNAAKSQPVTIGPLSFPSMRQASLALGFQGDYVSKVLRSGSVTRWQNLLGAAMRHAQEQAERAGNAA